MARYSVPTEKSVIEVVIEAVSQETGKDPFEMTPFSERFQVDSLDCLFTRSGGTDETELTILYEGCRVEISSSWVTVERLPLV